MSLSVTHAALPSIRIGLQTGNAETARPSQQKRKENGSKLPLNTARPHLNPQKPQAPRTSSNQPRTGRQGSSRPRPARKCAPSLTPVEAIRRYANALTPFEQAEILEYKHIYFVGAHAQKIHGLPHTPKNNGYDDDRGDYTITMRDHLDYRYEVKGFLGRGSFGQVVRATDHKNGVDVALKIIRNKKRFHHQALVEVGILERLMMRDRDQKSNIVRTRGYFYFRNHLCITFECLGMNLYEFIKKNNFRGFSLSFIKKIALQLLLSLRLLHQERIIHCDLKPENVLLKSSKSSVIRVIDFGSSCYVNECVYTYIQSRFYRAPEVILGLGYGMPIDMWSLGCVLAELYTGYPLFPGENETEQIQCIMEILGPPSKAMIQRSSRRASFFDSKLQPLLVPNSRGKIRTPASKDLSHALHTNDPQFLSFLRRCLRWEPAKRMTPMRALEHPWIADLLSRLESSNPTSGDQTQRLPSQRVESRTSEVTNATTGKQELSSTQQFLPSVTMPTIPNLNFSNTAKLSESEKG
jgi:serine/threonine protein kinase